MVVHWQLPTARKWNHPSDLTYVHQILLLDALRVFGTSYFIRTAPSYVADAPSQLSYNEKLYILCIMLEKRNTLNLYILNSLEIKVLYKYDHFLEFTG